MAMSPILPFWGGVRPSTEWLLKRAFFATLDRLLHPRLWEETPFTDNSGRKMIARVRKLEYPNGD